MKKYIWYGKDKFDINKLKKFELNDNILVSQHWDKPKEYYRYSDDTARLCYPFDALWASPIDTSLSWVDYCKRNKFNLDKFGYCQIFSLKNDAKILIIDSLDSLNKFLKKYAKKVQYSDSDVSREEKLIDVTEDIDVHQWVSCGLYRFNWNAIINDYDCMEISHDFNFNLMHRLFYTWDCDSIVIWNPKIISLCHED